MRIGLAQINPSVGDIEGNMARICEVIESAESNAADLVIFPELAVTGYPPEDLLLKPRFIQQNIEAVERIAKTTKGCTVVVGFVHSEGALFNAAAVCRDGAIVGVYKKQLLPNYGVFDECRYFKAGDSNPQLFDIAGVRVGVSVCEDAWSADGPIAGQTNAGAELLVSINASPFNVGRLHDRERVLRERAIESNLPLVYVNQVGGQDELVFDGASLIVNARGEVLTRSSQFSEEIAFVDFDPADPKPQMIVAELSPVEELYSALVLGVRDYVSKNGFKDVVIGLSGGIDSTLVATIAVDALGADNVHGVSMPSRYSSAGSKSDAQLLAEALEIDFRTIPIEDAHKAFETMIGYEAGITDENLQSRIRGVTLMALSNEHGWLVLTTGNKSELAVGYSTLYGDTAGGFAVIKDVYKTKVYELCRWRNEVGSNSVIPEDVLTKPPSAELRDDQRDDDSLPSYDVLDPILKAYVEEDLVGSEIVDRGFDSAVVSRIVRLVDLAEYKRRQSPIGVRVSPKAFGRDRRMPITNLFPSSD